jgi:hypothetical protein
MTYDLSQDVVSVILSTQNGLAGLVYAQQFQILSPDHILGMSSGSQSTAVQALAVVPRLQLQRTRGRQCHNGLLAI